MIGKYLNGIRNGYEKLVNPYNTGKSNIDDKRILEKELKNSHGLAENLNNRSSYERGLSDENFMDNNSSIFDTLSSVTCDSCIFHKTQVDELNNKICDLMDQEKELIGILQGNERLRQALSRKLEEKDCELHILANRLNSELENNSHIQSMLESANDEKNKMCTQLSDKLDEIECLKNGEVKAIEYGQELKTKLINQEEKLKELKYKLSIQEIQLKESEESNRINEKSCNDLMIQNEDLQNKLNDRNQGNGILDENVKKFQCLYRVANENEKKLMTDLIKCAKNLEVSYEENKKMESELTDLTTSNERLSKENNLLCKRIAKLTDQEQKCQSNVIKVSKSTSTDSSSCSTDLHGKMCVQQNNCPNGSIVSKYFECIHENTKLKRQLSEHRKTIQCIQQKSQHTENELKKLYENKMVQTSLETQKTVLKKTSQNESLMNKIISNNTKSDGMDGENTQTHTTERSAPEIPSPSPAVPDDHMTPWTVGDQASSDRPSAPAHRKSTRRAGSGRDVKRKRAAKRAPDTTNCPAADVARMKPHVPRPAMPGRAGRRNEGRNEPAPNPCVTPRTVGDQAPWDRSSAPAHHMSAWQRAEPSRGVTRKSVTNGPAMSGRSKRLNAGDQASSDRPYAMPCMVGDQAPRDRPSAPAHNTSTRHAEPSRDFVRKRMTNRMPGLAHYPAMDDARTKPQVPRAVMLSQCERRYVGERKPTPNGHFSGAGESRSARESAAFMAGRSAIKAKPYYTIDDKVPNRPAAPYKIGNYLNFGPFSQQYLM